jgi:hypothetical protein
MPRQRMIRPELWGDEGFLELSLGARLLFIGLISHADDEGRGTAGATSLKTRIFPCDNFTQPEIEAFKAEIAAKVRCVFYQVEGKEYYELTRFLNHQTINRPSASAIPKPTHGTLSEDSVNAHGTLSERSPRSKERSKESPKRALSARLGEEKKEESIETEEAGGSAPLRGAGLPSTTDEARGSEDEAKKSSEEYTEFARNLGLNDFSSIGKGPFD